MSRYLEKLLVENLFVDRIVKSRFFLNRIANNLSAGEKNREKIERREERKKKCKKENLSKIARRVVSGRGDDTCKR